MARLNGHYAARRSLEEAVNNAENDGLIT